MRYHLFETSRLLLAMAMGILIARELGMVEVTHVGFAIVLWAIAGITSVYMAAMSMKVRRA